MKILVTGSNGFVGFALCEHLASLNHHVWAQARNVDSLLISGRPSQYLNALHADLSSISTQMMRLEGVQAVVHCAARVHLVSDKADDPLSAYRAVNTKATLALAQAAANAGVKRFVFLSSVKVNGEFTQRGETFTSSQAAPRDPYGVSKWEAELGLQDIATKTEMEVVIIRPPLVYGAGVKANFLTMMRTLHLGIPLPFGAIRNLRSLVALPNLLDFITLCLSHSKAANQTFMISDQQDSSITQLLRDLGDALKRPARLIPVQQDLLVLGLKAVGKANMAQRLCSDLTVDSSPATELLGWTPPVNMQQGLQLTADHFLRSQVG
jgi:nucleoside-diphosphate-sugar epimerase